MKKVFMLVMVALMTLGVSQKAQAIEDPNPIGTLVVGVRCNMEPGYHYFGAGANIVGDYTLIDHWWIGHLTVGGFIGSNFNTLHMSHFAFMPRVTYGLNITNDFEVHAALMLGLGVRHLSLKHYPEDYDYNRVYFAHGELLGCRYYFTPNIGVEAEMGYTYTMGYFNVGVTFRL